jgi:hypothetical protein
MRGRSKKANRFDAVGNRLPMARLAGARGQRTTCVTRKTKTRRHLMRDQVITR